MSDQQTCSGCVYFKRDDSSPKADIGKCHRRAAVLKPYMAGEGCLSGTFPEVFDYDWCGEYWPTDVSKRPNFMLSHDASP